MASKKLNRRRKSRKSALERRIRHLKGFVATVAIILLSALGLWRCLDGSGKDGKKTGTPAPVSVEKVDVGNGKVADPTLVNENRLLKEEAVDDPGIRSTPVETADKDTESQAPTLETRFPLYGVAFHFHSQLKAAPDHNARVIAYARRGATFRLSERVSTKGCSRGWYEVSPGGLFVCNGAGVIVDDAPVTFAPAPPQPRLDQPLPYGYAYAAKDNTPEYWRIPTEAEASAVAALFERLNPAPKPEPPTPVTTGTDTQAPSTGTAPPAPAPSADAVVAVGAPGDMDLPGEMPDAGAANEGGDELPPYVHLRMAKGYYVSTDDKVIDGARAFQRTVRGRLIPFDRLVPATPSDFEGFLVNDTNPLPRAFVVGGGVSLLRREKDGALVNHEKVGRLTMLDYLGEMTRRNRRYIQVGEGLFLSSRITAVARAVTPPDDLKENERWIHIDLSEQTLVAYEGTRPVFATLVSTGRNGFETPTGTFHIYSKHVTVTMDDPDAGEEAYSIEDVPWVQYFEESYALHAAFWHNRFGRVRSHGCVNLAPKDAMRLFKWTGPAVPDGIHGTFATKANPGTRVVIQE